MFALNAIFALPDVPFVTVTFIEAVLLKFNLTAVIVEPLFAETVVVFDPATAVSNAVFTASEVAAFASDVLRTDDDKSAATSKLLHRELSASFAVACHFPEVSYQRRVPLPVAAAPLSTL